MSFKCQRHDQHAQVVAQRGLIHQEDQARGAREYGQEPGGEGLLGVSKVKGTFAEEALEAPFVGGGGGVFGKDVGDLGELAVLGEAQSVGEAGELFGFGAARVGEDGLDGLPSVVYCGV